jgi:hypothetical protein
MIANCPEKGAKDALCVLLAQLDLTLDEVAAIRADQQSESEYESYLGSDAESEPECNVIDPIRVNFDQSKN